MSKLNYRPEIDGLRAIAVIAVILYHSQIILFNGKWLEGGFIGVDIFFVISGYLISTIILKEINENNRFEFLEFYKRRARRIIPVLLVVMLATFPLGWVFLLPNEFYEFSQSIISSLLFISNFFFHYASIEYAADNSLLKPFLHTWSLSIEEQFYIFFPIILIILYKYFPKRILSSLACLGIISIIFATYLSFKNLDLNFFHPASRAWELLTGSCLAYTELRHGRQQNKTLHKILPTIGIILIILSIIYFSNKTPHPSLYTIFPILGVSFIIFFSNKDEIIGKILSSKPFVSIGLISYSLYLWHFPIFAFARIKYAPHLDFFKWITLTIVLSILSYFLIEKPFRNKHSYFSNYVFHFLFFLLAITFTLNIVNIYKGGFPSRVPEIFTHEELGSDPWEKLEIDGQKCFDRKSNFCTFETNKTNKWVHLIGDSHMGSLEYDLVNRLSNTHNILSANMNSCWPIKNSNIFASGEESNRICDLEWQNKRIETIHEKGNDSIIVIAGRLPLYLNNSFFDNKEGGKEDGGREWKDATSNYSQETIKTQTVKTLEELLEKKHNVILVYPIPEVGWNTPQKLNSDRPINNLKLNEYLQSKPITTRYETYLERSKSSFNLLGAIQHENLYRVYPHTLFCNNQIKNRCITHDTKNLFYFDDDHPNLIGAKLINNLIIKKINEIEAAQ